MTIIGVASDNVITVDVHSLCRLRGQVDRRATSAEETRAYMTADLDTDVCGSRSPTNMSCPTLRAGTGNLPARYHLYAV